MKLKDLLPYLYADTFIINSVRSTLSRVSFGMDERDELSNLYGEIPVIRIRPGFRDYILVIILD